MKIIVQGMGPVGCFGAGSGDLETFLRMGHIPVPESGENDRGKSSGTGHGHTNPLWFRADDSKVRDFFPSRKLRRIDHFSSLALLGASLAVQDAGPFSPDLENAGLIVASAYGASRTTFAFKDSFLDRGDRLSMPTLFSNSVHNAAAAHISTLLGIRGPSLTISQFDLSMTSAVYTAVQWLKERRVSSVLVGGIDEYTGLTGHAAGFLTKDKESRPYVSGEGGCFFLLSRDEDHHKKGYATLKDPVMDHRNQVLGTDDTIIMGSFGHGCCKEPAVESYLSYVQMYGSFPASAAIDMAVACLSLKNGVVFNSGEGHVATPPLTEKIKCIKPGNDSLWGAVSFQ